MKRTVRLPSVEDDDILPLSDGVLTTNLGLDIVVIVTKVRIKFSFLKASICLY